MHDLDDLDFQERAAEVEAPRREPPVPLWAVLAGAAVIILAAAGYVFLQKRGATQQKPRAVTEQAVDPVPAAPKRAAELPEDIPLPPLDQTDTLVRELLTRLSAHPRIAAWLATDGLIRNFAVTVTNIADAQTPTDHLKRLAPEGKFLVAREGTTVRVDVQSYRRYDGHADAVSSIDARGAARLYATLKPRLEEAYAELGAPQGTFDRALQRAIAHLLETPVVEGPMGLEPVPAGYAYADPALEKLSPAQKQLLRMGPRNIQIVQGKLREIREYLGF